MKSKVKFSRFSILITVGTIGLLVIGMIVCRDIPTKVITLGVILAAIMIPSMYYAPLRIELTPETLTIRRLLKCKHIPCSEIASADWCYPSGGGIRLCGSGGFMGYWGYFNDVVLGTYFGYIGDRNQCILLKLKSGKKYVISCENYNEMLKEINKYLTA